MPALLLDAAVIFEVEVEAVPPFVLFVFVLVTRSSEDVAAAAAAEVSLSATSSEKKSLG